VSTPVKPAAAAATVVVAAALLLAVTNGTRSSWGLFIGPINSATGFGAATVSFAIAAAALAWGAAQPLNGVLIGRFGVVRLLIAGGVLVAATTAAVPLASNGWEFGVAFAISGAAAAAAGSAPLLMGVVASRVTLEQRGVALGVLAAGGSLGQLLFAPAVALMIGAVGWNSTMLALAVIALAVTPLALAFRGGGSVVNKAAEPRTTSRTALASSDYWLVTAGFFVCGFHVSLLTTHMPGVIDLCGLTAGFSGIWLALVGACNIVGSIGIGFAMQRWQMKSLLATAYALRALGVALFLVAPVNAVTLSVFALWMGLTFMVTLPLTSGLIAHLFGARNLATLFGVTMAVHQLGSFLGAALGGLELELTGGYHWIWLVDIALAVAAAAVHLPVREARSGARIGPALAAAAR
jgi:predicted MFS family arabinose efflux permease